MANMEIPVNVQKDEVIEGAISTILNTLKEKNSCTLCRDRINKAQALLLCDMFYKKGYHHEIRMHHNGLITFFYCVTISKTPVCTNDARLAWSENVRWLTSFNIKNLVGYLKMSIFAITKQ